MSWRMGGAGGGVGDVGGDLMLPDCGDFTEAGDLATDGDFGVESSSLGWWWSSCISACVVITSGTVLICRLMDALQPNSTQAPVNNDSKHEDVKMDTHSSLVWMTAPAS